VSAVLPDDEEAEERASDDQSNRRLPEHRGDLLDPLLRPFEPGDDGLDAIEEALGRIDRLLDVLELAVD
jgi:hypothetical protein